jgi:hypothetical protein
MQPDLSIIGLLAWLQAKHFVADYLMQPGWMLRGKGKILHPGAYAHAGAHAMGSAGALILLDLTAFWVGVLAVGEFGLHLTIDHVKAVYTRAHPASPSTRSYWALHGLDQLLHHFTYTAMLLLIVALKYPC